VLTKTYEAQVLEDGHLSVREDVRQELGLKKGDRVEVTVKRSGPQDSSETEATWLSAIVISPDTSFLKQVRSILDGSGQIKVRAELNKFYSGLDNQTLDEIKSLAPDIIVVDLSPDKEQGIETIERMAELSKHSRIFVFGEGTDVDTILRSMRAGAREYISKPIGVQPLLSAAERVSTARAVGVDLDNPLVQLIAICEGSNKTDFSLKHDLYLYHEDEP